MKRPPGIWILLSAGVLWLCFQNVYGIRATSLIFSRTTTTTPGPVPNVTDGIPSESEVATDVSTEASSNVTKPPLTGIPQIDYIYDPNLPKELNGYNLSEYPFYERVPDPEEIDFKCDGLHDGFYASIPFKCQVYHHCLFGTRYDFLCANYTAFDQKTFICQFVSDVDCVGSKKFWHRNDALYKAATTTTSKPLNIYTQAPQSNPEDNGGGRRGGGKRRRPPQRRPQYDYYDDDDEYDDDYYEDRPRSRRRRPRPRPRPIYDDDDDYEDDYDMYERRNRRPYNRRGADRRRNKNRNRDSEERPKGDRKKLIENEEDDERNHNMRDEEEKRKPSKHEYEDEKRKPPRDEPEEEKRKPSRHEYEDDNRKPPRDEHDEEKRKSPNNKRKHVEDDYEEISRPSRRKTSRRPPPPPEEEDYEDKPPKRENRPRKKIEDDETPIIKPTTGTIYDRPRVAPRIKPPVPKNEANKYAYKPISKSKTPPPINEDEYYDDYEEDLPPPSSTIKSSKGKRIESNEQERKQASSTFRRTKTTLDEEDDALTLPQNNKNKQAVKNRSRYEETTRRNEIKKEKTTKKPPIESEYYDDDEYDIEKNEEYKISSSTTTETSRKRWKPFSSTLKTTSSTTTSTTTTTTPPRTTFKTTTTTESYKEERPEQIVRIVKRPFLPSRGGNPYSSRGLQPVGFKASKPEVMEQQSSLDVKQEFSKSKHKFSEPISDDDDDFKPIKKPIHILRPSPTFDEENNEFNGPRTTQKPKIPERNPLDIIDSDYDVTLNDALSPTLPNLPVRPNYPTNYNPATDYTFSAFQRQRYVLEPVVSSANNDYIYHSKQPSHSVRQRFEVASHHPSSYSRDQYVAPSNEYKYYTSPVVGNSNVKRGLTQAFYNTGYHH